MKLGTSCTKITGGLQKRE